MAKILEFRLPEPQPLTAEQKSQQILTKDQALDVIVTAMVCHVMPMWIENRWPFKALEIMSQELREAMTRDTPNDVTRGTVDAVILELQPVWIQIAQQAAFIF